MRVPAEELTRRRSAFQAGLATTPTAPLFQRAAAAGLTAAGLAGAARLAAAFLILAAIPAGARPALVPLSSYTSFGSISPDRIGSPAFNSGATRLAFLHCFDPLGANPTAATQLFVARRDGTGLLQLTSVDSFIEPRHPAWSLDDTYVFFTAQVSNPTRRELYRALAAGGEIRRLTFQGGAAGADPIGKVAATGTQSAIFATRADLLHEGLSMPPGYRNIYRASAGGAIVRLTDPASQPLRGADVLGVSADGSLVAYAAEDNQLPGSRPFRPYILDTGSGLVTTPTPDQGASALKGDLTPIGGVLMISSDADYTGANGSHHPEIFRVDAIGSGATQLTDVQFTGVDRPAIDGTASLVLFESKASIDVGEHTGTSRVYTLPSGAADPRRVSTGYDGTVSLDAAWLAYVDTADSLGLNMDSSPEIFTVAADGRNRRQVTRFVRGTSNGATVSEDGQWAAFISTGDLDGGNPDGSAEVYISRTDGSARRRLTNTLPPYGCREPGLSADGQVVVFASNGELVGSSNTDHNYEIFRINADSTGLAQLTGTTSGESSIPAVSADGTVVAFASTANLKAGADMGHGRVAVWRSGDNSVYLATTSSDQPLEKLFLSHDGSHAVVLTAGNIDDRNTLHLRRPFGVDTAPGTLMRTWPATISIQTRGLGVDPQGNWLIVAYDTGVLALLPYSGSAADTVFKDPAVVAATPSVTNGAQKFGFSVGIGSGSYNNGDYFVIPHGGGAPVGLIGAAQPFSGEAPALSGDGRRVVFVMTRADTLNRDGSIEVFSAALDPVPVALSGFMARRAGDNVAVEWTAATDGDHAFFLVERSDGELGPFIPVSPRITGPGPLFRFVDPRPPSTPLWYRLAAVDRRGGVEHFGPVTAAPAAPERARVRVFPSPFVRSTTVTFSLPAAGAARVDILDVLGRRVRRLFDGVAPAGDTTLPWDGRDDAGGFSASGVYFVRLNDAAVARMIRVR